MHDGREMVRISSSANPQNDSRRDQRSGYEWIAAAMACSSEWSPRIE